MITNVFETRTTDNKTETNHLPNIALISTDPAETEQILQTQTNPRKYNPMEASKTQEMMNHTDQAKHKDNISENTNKFKILNLQTLDNQGNTLNLVYRATGDPTHLNTGPLPLQQTDSLDRKSILPNSLWFNRRLSI